MGRIEDYSAYKTITGDTSYKGVRYPKGDANHWARALASVSTKKVTKTAKRPGTKKKTIRKKATKTARTKATKSATKSAPAQNLTIDQRTQIAMQNNYRIRINKNKIIQSPLLNIKRDSPNLWTYKELPETVKHFNENFNAYVRRQIDMIFDRVNPLSIMIKPKYALIEDGLIVREEGKNFWFTRHLRKSIKITQENRNKKDFNIELDSIQPIMLGYRISYVTPRRQLNDIARLRAFHPTSNRKFHAKTSVSTSDDGKICIYETWHHIFIESIKNRKLSSKKYKADMINRLKSEGDDIESAVINGELVRAIQLLTTRYKTKTLISFFSDSNTNIVIDNGKTIEKPDTTEFIGKECFLYDGHHVAPFIYSRDDSNKDEKDNKPKRQFKFIMRPQHKKEYRNKDRETVHYFRYSENVGKDDILEYYDIIVDEDKTYKTIKEFADYLDTFERVGARKSSKKHAVQRHLFYSSGNSRTFNIPLFRELRSRDPSIDCFMAGSKIQNIKYRSVEFRDTEILDVPDTLYQTVYGTDDPVKAVKMHHEKYSRGEINGRIFETTKSTPAAIAKAIYEQCFLDCNIYASDPDILQAERESYRGSLMDCNTKGMVNETINYYDICSSYPSEMRTDLMPYRMLEVVDFGEIISNFTAYRDEYLYYAKLDRNGSKAITKLPTDEYIWVWGVELQILMESGFKIETTKLIMYEDKDDLFKPYVDYFYDQKLKGCKMAKIMLNSLYGKFAQTKKYRCQYMNHIDDCFQYIKSVDQIIDVEFLDDDSVIMTYDDGQKYQIGDLVRFSAYIAARARASLMRGMKAIDWDLYYYDTDSIITKRKLPDEFITTTREIGKFKIEGIYDQAVFIGKKCYRLKNKNETLMKAAGVTMEDKDYDEIVRNGHVSLCLDQTKRDKNGTVKNVKVTKTIKYQ